MKKSLLLSLLFVWNAFGAFTEFYCDTAGSNLNAGSTTNTTAAVTETNGDWGNAAANRFTAASGTPFSGVSVGDWASIYTDGASTGVFVGRITAVNASGASIDISTTARAGTPPSNSATGRSCKVGGAWKGPNGTDGVPLTLATGALKNTSTNTPRVNFKAGTYSVTAAMTCASNADPIQWEGYTTSPGDGGFGIIDGGSSGASYVVLTVTGKNNTFKNLKFNGNGATSSADGVSSSGGSENLFYRCVFSNMRGNGLLISGVNGVVQCEAFSCNASNTTSKAGFSPQSSGVFMINCISHHNTGSNAGGYQTDGGIVMIGCIASDNGGAGARSTADVLNNYYGCSFYNNTGSGIDFATAGITTDAMLISCVNCSFLKNGGAGFRLSGASAGFINGVFLNCAFGAGTMANTTGNFQSGLFGVSSDGSSIHGLDVSGTITLASNTSQWVDATTGDFRNNLSTIKGTGFGEYLQTYTGSTWTGTVAYPDIGAAEHQDSASSGQKSYVVP